MAHQGRPGHTGEPSRWPWMFWAREPACFKDKEQAAEEQVVKEQAAEEPAPWLQRFRKSRSVPAAHAQACAHA